MQKGCAREDPSGNSPPVSHSSLLVTPAPCKVANGVRFRRFLCRSGKCNSRTRDPDICASVTESNAEELDFSTLSVRIHSWAPLSQRALISEAIRHKSGDKALWAIANDSGQILGFLLWEHQRAMDSQRSLRKTRRTTAATAEELRDGSVMR